MSYQTILTEKKDKSLFVTLNRPEVRNAFNDEVIHELASAFQNEATDETIRLVVLKGEGKVFSAGGDLEWMKKSAQYTREQNIHDTTQLSKLLETINTLPKPVIGQVHGAALGGGMGLVSVCDLVVASKETVFGFTETKLGLIPAVIGPYVVPKIGESMARALFLTAERFGASRAYEMGLIHQIADTQEQLSQASEKVIKNVLTSAPKAIAIAKNFLSTIKGKTLPEQNSLAAQTLADIRASEEGQEGIAAFLEKRKANWIVD